MKGLNESFEDLKSGCNNYSIKNKTASNANQCENRAGIVSCAVSDRLL